MSQGAYSICTFSRKCDKTLGCAELNHFAGAAAAAARHDKISGGQVVVGRAFPPLPPFSLQEKHIFVHKEPTWRWQK